MNLTRFVALFTVLILSGCTSVYYDTLEKVGYHKREILVDRVESTRDAQNEAQEQFQSALEQFATLIELKDTDLKRAYESLNQEYEASRAAAGTVSERIDSVESVAEALFEEWEEELELYQNQRLRSASREKLAQTRERYGEMLKTMHRAEKSMQPVLEGLQDNVLYLKHNLNAQAIGALRGEFADLEADISRLITRMNRSIERSNQFIRDLQEQ